MFCPICGALSFPDSKNNIKCPDYKCGYEGPLAGPDGKGGKIIDPMSGEEIDLTNATAKNATKSLKHLTEVVEEEVARGILRVGDYICPNCEENRVYVWMQQTRSSDEPETKMCTCESCNKKWREYQ